jgi:hypothetical protein
MRQIWNWSVRGGMTALALALGACSSTGAYYQPLEANRASQGGYAEVRLSEDRYEVIFVGNQLTSREQVETYLLYRAAELTLQQRYDWFVIEQQGMEHTVERDAWVDPRYSPWFARDYGYWRPYWRYYGPTIGWRSWYPHARDPFWADHIDGRTVERFEAKANIRIGRGPVPQGIPGVFVARDVIERLGPRIQRPKP